MLRLKSLFRLDDLFTSEWVISLSCPIQCCFVALHDYDRYALWLVASPSFASLPPAPRGDSACASTITFLNQLFHLSPPYLPIYGIYVPSLTKTFMYHLKTSFKSFLFVTVQAHGAVRRNQYLSCQKYLTEVLTSKMQKEKSCTSPIHDDGRKWAKCC